MSSTWKRASTTVWQYGGDILRAERMQEEKRFLQHGKVSVYRHSVRVACTAVYLAKRFGISVNLRALVRGALLHDYFLYDWHVPDKNHRLHGFTHARKALKNARRDFELGAIEQDIIAKHMFPLNLAPPRYRESVLVCLADKLSAAAETAGVRAGAKRSNKAANLIGKAANGTGSDRVSILEKPVSSALPV